MRAAVLVVEVVDVAGRHEGQPRSLRKLLQLRVDASLGVQPRVLDLDVSAVLAEDLHEPVEVGGGVLGAVLLERLGDAPDRQPESAMQPGRVALEQLPVHTRLVVVALEEAGRGELDQVSVALVRLGQKVRCA